MTTSVNRINDTRVHIRAFERVMLIHKEISSGKHPSTKQLAHLLERSEKTVKRDINALRDQHKAPLHFDKKQNGWRYLDPAWSPYLKMTEGELLAFFSAEYMLRVLGRTPEAKILKSAVAKLATYLPDEVMINLNHLGESLSFETTAFVEVKPDKLKELASAAAERRTVNVNYYSQHRNEHTNRDLDILCLHNFAGDWYAIAFDHLRKEVRDFHVGRIKQLHLTNRYFDLPESWDANEHLKRGFFMTRGGRQTKVSIVFDSYQARWIRERNTFHPNEQREELPDGSLRLSFHVGRDGLDAVARFCLAYAGHFRVEQPAALRKIVREKLEKTLAQNFPV